MLKSLKTAADYISQFITQQPKIAIVLGTGLGNFSDEIEISVEIPYHNIPGFPVSGVDGHKGSLLFARYQNIPVIVMQGRVHFYEGYSMEQIIYPIRLFHILGIENLIITNAAGGMNAEFMVGDLMIINDHINMMPNPLIGEHIPEFGPRFPDMSEVYDKHLIEKAKAIARHQNIRIFEGCYVAVTGPTYETPAEYKFYHLIGGNAIGMSTVPEVIAARQMGMKCFAISVITDLGIGDNIPLLTHEMVQEAANETEPKVAAIIKGLILEMV
jgi:purine-nucleoside phosphorylase